MGEMQPNEAWVSGVASEAEARAVCAAGVPVAGVPAAGVPNEPVAAPVAPDAEDIERGQRIQDEFVRSEATLDGLGAAVACYGSARTQPTDPLYVAAREVGSLLAARGVATITGGGPGIMEAANRGAVEAGGLSVGLCINLPFEAQNSFLTHQLVFRYLFVRKTCFERFAGAAIVFPGGFGTLDELFELLTLVQTGKEEARPIVLFGSSYWDGLVRWLREAPAAMGYISSEDLLNLPVTDSPEEAVALACAGLVH